MNRELLKEILEWHKSKKSTYDDFEYLMDAVEAELAKPEPEPMTYYCKNDPDVNSAFSWKQGKCNNCSDVLQPLYAAIPDQSARIAELEQQLAELQTLRGKCTLVPTDKLEDMQQRLKVKKPLTDKEIRKIAAKFDLCSDTAIAFAWAIEAAHGITND